MKYEMATEILKAEEKMINEAAERKRMTQQEEYELILREAIKCKMLSDEIAELKKQNKFQFENLRFMIKGLAYSMIFLGVGIILSNMIHLVGK